MITNAVLAPEAAADLVEIWHYVARTSSKGLADRVESAILTKINVLAESPGIGHWRRDLTSKPVKFLSVYSYLIVYRPGTDPIQIVAILRGKRDVKKLMRGRY